MVLYVTSGGREPDDAIRLMLVTESRLENHSGLYSARLQAPESGDSEVPTGSDSEAGVRATDWLSLWLGGSCDCLCLAVVVTVCLCSCSVATVHNH